MNDPTLQSSIEELVVPFLKETGVDLVDLQLSGNVRRRMLRIFVDREGGITIGECASLSRGLADVLDTHDPINGRYVLEISSPGLDRPLRTEQDYQRAVGQAVKLVLENGMVVVGTLIDRNADRLILKKADETLNVTVCEIKKANLHFEF